MTTKLTVAGGIEDALTHFAAAGLAEVLTDAGVTGVRWGWDDGRRARAVVETPLSGQEIGQIVLDQAARCADDSSWVQAVGADSRPGVLSPRVGVPKTRAGWAEREVERRRAIDRVKPGSSLDERFLVALGRPAYWNIDATTPNPDAGASRWEMKTRNRGETFVGERLAPLAKSVAARNAVGVLVGLTGEASIDEVGKNKADSRTATGLVSPRPVDNALAWCALWGLAATGTWWHATRVGISTAVGPAGITHPRWAVLPVFATTVTAARYRRTLRSRDWAELSAHVTPGGAPLAQVPSSTLQSLGVTGVEVCAVFSIFKGGSSSAPERYLEAGRLAGLRP